MGSFYAIEVLEKAIEDVKELLFPFKATDWLKMILVVLLVGGFSFSMNIPGDIFEIGENIQHQVEAEGGAQIADTAFTGMMSAGELLQFNIGLLLFMLILLASLVSTLWIVAGNIMEFVFVKICADREIKILNNFSGNIVNGLRLLGFNILVMLVFGIIIGVPFIMYLLLGIRNIPFFVFYAVLGILLFLIVNLVSMFTTDFVIVRMLEQKKGIWRSWEEVFNLLNNEWKQTSIYILFRIIITIGTSIIGAIIFLVLMIPVLLIAGLFVLITVSVYNSMATPGIVIGLVFGVIIVLLVLFLSLTIRVPLMTFVRYYSIRVFEKFANNEIIVN